MKNIFILKKKPTLVKNNTISLSRVITLLLSLTLVFSASACTSAIANQDPAAMRHTIILEYNKDAYRAKILLEDMPLKVAIAPPGPLPYSANASASVWVGTDFPYQAVADAIAVSRKYYPQIRYVALSDYRLKKAPRGIHRELYIGGSTDTAVRLELHAWSENDFARLKKIGSKDELHALIRSKYPENKIK